MPFTYIRRAAVAFALLAAAGCTVKSTQPPPLTGPSGLALTLNVNAIPDAISQDGGSQSSVKVTAIGPDGKPISGLPLRLDMFVGGVPQDYGTLSARSIVTNSDGVATAVYTAPPSPAGGVFGTCSGLPGNCVTIKATPTSTNFTTANPEQVLIRLVPTGVILPPASLPTAAFTFSPTPATVGVLLRFDASTSEIGNGASQIVSYAWDFGDGKTATGKQPTHTFDTGATFTVSLTVTNDRALSASTSRSVTVTTPIPVPPGLAERTQFRVGLRAQQLRQHQPRRRALWIAAGVSWAAGVASAPYVWRLFAWLGEYAGVPKLVWEAGFALWWAVPALVAAAVLLAEHEKQTGESYWLRRSQ